MNTKQARRATARRLIEALSHLGSYRSAHHEYARLARRAESIRVINASCGWTTDASDREERGRIVHDLRVCRYAGLIRRLP